MLTDAECRSLAEQCLARLGQQCGEDLVLLPAEYRTASTLVFTYQTADYIASRDFAHALTGNGPILVSKLNGTIELAGSAIPVDACVRDFELRTVASDPGR